MYNMQNMIATPPWGLSRTAPDTYYYVYIYVGMIIIIMLSILFIIKHLVKIYTFYFNCDVVDRLKCIYSTVSTHYCILIYKTVSDIFN